VGGLGIAEIGRTVGGTDSRGTSTAVVLSALCQLFDATAEGFSSSILLLTAPARKWEAPLIVVCRHYIKQLEAGGSAGVKTPSGATINAKKP